MDVRQYAGFGTASHHQPAIPLLPPPANSLSVAFDLPTQRGLDSDHELASGEVGKVGVAIDTIDDMRRLFAGIPLGDVSTSMTINATAPILLLLYQLVAEEQGVPAEELRGTVQNDILKEYVARTYIYPPGPSMRLVTDLFAYAAEELPAWNTISISGYHIREAGATAAQELAFTIANGIAYVRAAMDAGLEVDQFAPRLSFFWNGHNHFFEEIAKFRAARRMWARLMRDLIGTDDPASQKMDSTPDGGIDATAQQPLNNVVRTTVQALAAILGEPSRCTPTPTTRPSASRPRNRPAGAPHTADPPTSRGSPTPSTLRWQPFHGGAHRCPGERPGAVRPDRGDGGAVAAIEAGFMQAQIEEAAYAEARRQESGESVVVGVNRFQDDADEPVPVLKVDPELERDQVARLQEWRAKRGPIGSYLEAIEDAARSDTNLLPVMKEALAAGATVGEVSDALRSVFGTYRR